MKKALFSDLIESVREAGKIRKGLLKPSRIFEFRPVDVKRVRGKLQVSQSQFALMIGVSRATLQNWEQGRREPEGPAKALLKVVEKNPKAVLEALQ